MHLKEHVKVKEGIMGASVRNHDIPLTATLTGSKVTIEGDGDLTLKKGAPAHRFRFTLNDETKLNVEFASLDREDNCSTCPPESGDNSDQIVAVTIGPHPGTAAFTDNNNNKGLMYISYQWNFTCDDPTKEVEPFDPVIINGGTT